MDSQTKSGPATARILVWDVPVRVFHWLMVLCFAGAYLTAEWDAARLLHITLGYTMAGLVAFRLVWGLTGTRYARFSEFVRSPRAVLDYLRSLFTARPRHYLGHNPAGALAILALIGLSLVVVAAGWATLTEVGGGKMEDIHEAAANLMLLVVGVHVAGVVISSRLHRENLVGAMIHGKKTGAPAERIRGARTVVGLVLLTVVLGFWGLQWQSAPLDLVSGKISLEQADHEKSHDDED